ncbi:hypothetical protein BdWA1_000240 [Babesia duncani]|uniref:Uncharacterized protein n=1 Tax=Babesia duncani TaxID=323732 RepID=A0AAD9PMF1_9APIC|nr:hypothetical protein BdWA1_000240 [Babesia duncani]
MDVFSILLVFSAFYVNAIAADDVKTFLFKKDVESTVEIDANDDAVLVCPIASVLIIKKARWLPVTGGDMRVKDGFSRTTRIGWLCNGLENCAFRPVAHLSKIGDRYEFLGQPIETDIYKLTVTATCGNFMFKRPGRREMLCIPTSAKPDIVLGCKDNEAIELSYVRVGGKSKNQWRHRDYCAESIIKTAHPLCTGKKTCKIAHDVFLKNAKECIPREFNVEYYCAAPHKNSFYDPLDAVVVDGVSVATKYVLTAEDGARASAKTNAYQVLQVDSALWESDGATERRDRLELVKFLCDGRAECVFSPTRSIIGPDERKCNDVVFGGMVKDTMSHFMLRAHFSLVPFDPKKYDEKEYHHVTIKSTEKKTLECPVNMSLTFYVALWGGKITDTSPLKGPKHFVEVDINGEKHRYSEIINIVGTQCFGKSKCEIEPLKLKPPRHEKDLKEFPTHEGVKKDDHQLELYYKCIDLQTLPSLVESLISDGPRYPREFITPIQLSPDMRIVVMLDIYGPTVLEVANALKLEIPVARTNEIKISWKDAKISQGIRLVKDTRNYVFEFVIGAEDYIHMTVNSFDNDGSPMSIPVEFEASKRILDFSRGIEDFVVATGEITNFRAFIKS